MAKQCIGRSKTLLPLLDPVGDACEEEHMQDFLNSVGNDDTSDDDYSAKILVSESPPPYAHAHTHAHTHTHTHITCF